VKDLYIERITATEIVISYKLSNLGYQETGISFSRKNDTQQLRNVKAIRVDNVLRVTLQGLDADTEYILNVFHKQNGANIIDEKEYPVKTLSAALAKYDLNIADSSINLNEDGSFIAEIQGKNLRDLNLAYLSIRVNNKPVQLDYPVKISDDEYRIRIKGTVQPVNNTFVFEGSYYEKEILFLISPYLSNNKKYSLHYAPTNLMGRYVSVFDNKLYYFLDKKILRWDEIDERLHEVGDFGEDQKFTIGNSMGIQFDGQIFFKAFEANIWHTNDVADYSSYPEVRSWSPENGSWQVFPFKEEMYLPNTRAIAYSHLFIHKGELYLAYSLHDIHQQGLPRIDDLVYHYDRSSKNFRKVQKIKNRLKDYRFVSLNGQLYLFGSVPIYDQGLEMASTLAAYKVNDSNFELEEIYRGGTIYEPVSFTIKDAIAYEQKILLGQSLTELMLFDPSNLQMSKVNTGSVSHSVFGNFFIYNNKFHLNEDLNISTQKIYEFSITENRQ